MTSPAESPADANPSTRKKFKYTQQLIHIALEDLTQEEIARICRVSQSIVSGWKNGQSRAAEHQIAELRRRYAHRLHRATFRVYLALVKRPEGEDWEPMKTITWTEEKEDWVPMKKPVPPLESGAAVEELVSAQDNSQRRSSRKPVRKAVPIADISDDGAPMERVTRTVERTRIEPDPDGFRVVQVEGAVTLRHTMHVPLGWSKANRLEREPVARWLVHHLARGRFVLVRQRRRNHEGAELALCREHNRNVPEKPIPVEAQDDAARWISFIEPPLSPEMLLQHADAAATTTNAGMLGAALLPFLVRKMLVELGYPVEGIERISADD